MIFIFKIFQIGCKLRMLIIGVTFGAIFRENRKCNEKKGMDKKVAPEWELYVGKYIG